MAAMWSPVWPYHNLFVPKVCKKEGDKGFSTDCWNRTRAKCFYLQEGKFRSDINKTFYKEGGGALAQVTQRDGRYPIAQNIQSQTRRGDLIKLKISLLIAEGLDSIYFKGPMVLRLSVKYIPGCNHIHPLLAAHPNSWNNSPKTNMWNLPL